MKNLFLFSIIFFTLLVTPVFAQTPEKKAKEHGVTFPISELGNCANFSECHAYCEDPINQNTCISFAKSHGFHQEEPTQTNKEAMLSRARAEFGCDSMQSCMAFCNNSANFDKCSSFAQRHGLSGGHVEDPGKAQMIEKAKEVLGCDSKESCMNFCSQEQNREKCGKFAKESGLRGGETHRGPGGCTSEETCKTFCSDPNNYQVCSGFTQAAGGRFSGPGGCTSEESCQAYCKENPQECGHFSSGGAPGGMTPEDYCKQYPDKCGGVSPSGEIPSGVPQTQYNPQEMCAKSPGCSWVNNTCQCQSTGEQQQREQQPSTGGTTETTGTTDFATQCGKAPGCSWTGTSCQCTGTSAPQPEQQQQSQTSTSQTETQPQPSTQYETQPQSTSSPSGVQGARTSRPGLIQSILQLILDL